MKRILAIIPMVICILYAFLPICKIIVAIGGYDFVLNNYLISIIVLALISIVAVVSLNILKISLSKNQAIFSALILLTTIKADWEGQHWLMSITTTRRLTFFSVNFRNRRSAFIPESGANLKRCKYHGKTNIL